MHAERPLYRWFYDNIQSRYYNALIKWCFLPFGGEAKVRQGLFESVPLHSGGRILDMCCGTGGATFALAKAAGAGSRITAIDLSSGQIRVAKKRSRFSNIEFLVADATGTCFRDEEFDLVVIPHAIHEMERSLRNDVLKEVKRILRDEGTLTILEMDNPSSLFLRIFVGFWWFYWLPFNFETPTRRDMLKNGLEKEVKEAGFNEVNKSSFHNGVFQVVQGRK